MKGSFHGECNRTVCKTSGEDVAWHNASTQAFYCSSCAVMIMRWPENKGLLEKWTTPTRETQ